MKKIKIILSLLFYIFVIGCSNSDSQLLNDLKDSVIKNANAASKKSTHYSILKLSELTSFDWDKFYVFDEYIDDKQISKITSTKWNGSSVPSGMKRILFIYRGEVVKYVDYAPISFPLFIYTCGLTEQYEFNIKDDRFAVFESCDVNGCNYAMAPISCIKDFEKLYLNKVK